MRRIVNLKIFLLTFITISIFNYCDEDDQPESEPLIVSTLYAVNIDTTHATAGGIIENKSEITIIEKGICWSIDTLPTIFDSKSTNNSVVDSFTVNITNLNRNTTYFIRAYVTTSDETIYGESLAFTTLGGEIGTVTDIDGNIYRTVAIGEQVWMAENLKTTKYRNDDPIDFVSTYYTYPIEWCNRSTGAYCYFYDNSDNYEIYGNLYNWWAVNDSREIAPAGWRIPTIDDWKILIRNLGGENRAGGKLKEVGMTHWIESNIGATDNYGFTALPGGELQAYDCSLVIMHYLGFWWSSTEYDNENSYNLMLEHGSAEAIINYREKISGLSVRCIKE